MKGVLIVPRNSSNSTWLVTFAACSLIRHFLRALAEERVRGAEQRADADHGGRNRAERRRVEGRERFLSVGREAELLERHSRDVQHAGPAQLLLSVDVIDVALGPVGDALVRFGEHLVARAVDQGVGRARLDARGRRDAAAEPLVLTVVHRLAVERDRQRLRDTVGAVRALRDLRRVRVPFRGRHVPRTRQLAVAAADALVVVVGDRTVVLPVAAPSSGRRRRTPARGSADSAASRTPTRCRPASVRFQTR